MPMADVTEQSFSGWAVSGLMGALNLLEGLAQKGLPFSQDDIVKLESYRDRLDALIGDELDARAP